MPPSLINRRVELVPQSMAATTLMPSPAVARPPTPDRVVAAGQEVRVVRVQAFHALAGAADATARSRAFVTDGYRRVALGFVAGVGRSERNRIDFGFGRAHAAVAFDLADTAVHVRPVRSQ